MQRRFLFLSIFVFMAVNFALSVHCSTLQAATVTVYAVGPYEVWGGTELIPDVELGGSGGPIVPGYYDTPSFAYRFLGQSDTTASFAGDYKYFVIGTTSLFTLDAILINTEAFQWPNMIDAGNIHLPWQFDADNNLIGDPFNYAHLDNIFGAPDGVTDDVGHPPGYFTGQQFQGFVALNAVPAPAAIWLFAAGLIGLAGFCRKKNKN